MGKSFSALDRSEKLKEMGREKYDLVIIGGGITGAGIALDATLRGMKVALVEMQDFASGTSSRSTKLIHGGLRYLKQLEWGIVKEVGQERAIVYENGPHVTQPEWMLLPFYKDGLFGPFTASIGLKMYDYLAKVKKAERRIMLTSDEVLKKEPLLKKEGLLGAGYYVEYKTDDARLTLEVMKAANTNGANIVNYTKAKEFLYNSEKQICGVVVRDLLTNVNENVFASIVINAAGPWVDVVRKQDRIQNSKQLKLTKGIHLVFSQSSFPLQQAVYFDSHDGRMIFAIPRENKTYVGTTDTFFNHDPAHPKMTVEDRDYLIEAIQFMFPKLGITVDDIESSWAGVRPLIYEAGKDPSEISRKDEIWEAESGLITIAGGKLTGYRKMAENVVDIAVNKLQNINGQNFKTCSTETFPLSGGNFGGSGNFNQFIEEKTKELKKMGLEEESAHNLIKIYGTNIDELTTYLDSYHQLKEKIISPVDYMRLMYSIHHEMALTPTDFFIRRTGWIYFNIDWVRMKKEAVMEIMDREIQWTIVQRERFRKELYQELIDAVIPIDVW